MKSSLKGPQLVDLKNSVVEFFTESNWRELGALTNTLDEVEGHPRLLRSLSWNDSDYEGLALTFLRKMIGEDDANLQVVLEYIHKICPSAGDYVSSEEVEGRRILFTPNIFQVPATSPDSQLVSVMMPFEPQFSPVYKSIQAAANQSGFKCTRADDIWNHSTVVQDIFSLIFESFIVVCDFTGKNPNVFYETGIAHTLGKHVIPITQSENDVPFDLKHHRYLKYLNNNEGLENLTTGLKTRLQTLG